MPTHITARLIAGVILPFSCGYLISYLFRTVNSVIALFYYASVAPVVIKDRLIVGVSGDDFDIPGYIQAVHPESGELQWRFYTVPGDPSKPQENKALEKAQQLRPDVVVMDLSMPGMGGLEATKRLTSETDCKVLVLTMHSEEEYLLPVLEAGGSG